MSSSYTVHFAVKEGLSMVMSGDYPQRFARALQVRLISQSTFEFEQSREAPPKMLRTRWLAGSSSSSM
jgi:hypothetical protein